MRKSLIAGVALLSLFAGVGISRAESKEIKGVLIDTTCCSKQMSKDDPETAAAAHPKSCAMKCADKGFSVISGKTAYKLDDASNTKAKEYLEKNDSTKVVVKGEEKDGALTISSIEAQK
jgi:hypothetical protein